MTLISSHFAVQVFVIIHILINLIRGDLEETIKCVDKISSKFGNCQTEEKCLKYAIEHYVKDQDTASSSQSASSSSQSASSFIPNDPKAYNVVDSSANFLDNSNEEARFDEGNEGEYVYSFDGLQAFIEADEQHQENYVSSEQVLRSAKLLHKALEPITEGTDYATLYHNKLETMISKMGVPSRDQFCKEYFTPALENPMVCIVALDEFGKTSISAVRHAFKSYTLEECKFLQTYYPKFRYITQYMQVIINQCQTNYLRKTPLQFCEKIVKEFKNLQFNQHSGQWNENNAT